MHNTCLRQDEVDSAHMRVPEAFQSDGANAFIVAKELRTGQRLRS